MNLIFVYGPISRPADHVTSCLISFSVKNTCYMWHYVLIFPHCILIGVMFPFIVFVTICKNNMLYSTDSETWKKLWFFFFLSYDRKAMLHEYTLLLVKPYLIINLVGRMKYILTEWVCRTLVCGSQHSHYPILFVSVSKMRPVTWFHNVYQFKHSISASAYVWERDYLLPLVFSVCLHNCSACVNTDMACVCRFCMFLILSTSPVLEAPLPSVPSAPCLPPPQKLI